MLREGGVARWVLPLASSSRNLKTQVFLELCRLGSVVESSDGRKDDAGALFTCGQLLCFTSERHLSIQRNFLIDRCTVSSCVER